MRTLDRRIGLLFAIFLVLLTAAIVRAGWLGTVRADALRAHAQSQQMRQVALPARRGTILDRNGVELAVSEDAVTVFANPFLIDKPAAVAARLAPLIGKPVAELTRILGDRRQGFTYLARKLDASRGAKVERLQIEGIGTQSESKRVYPQGSLASQLLGPVGTDGEGLGGLEAAHEQTLHGRDGSRRLVRDALGKPISIVEGARAEPGDDLRLTIDAPLQERVEAVLAETGERFQAKGASAVALDPRNGEILALANWPAIEPEKLGDTDAYERQNRALAANYEPGSTFKPFTVAGALEEKLIAPDTPFDLPPTIQVADREIGESHDRGPVRLTVAEILAQSSNVGAVKIGLLLGPNRFDRWIRHFGFGELTDVDLPGEAGGIVPRPSEYSGSSLGNLPIGQGLAVTPLQMAVGYAAIAAGGVAHRPHAIAGARGQARRLMSERVADQVSRMLEGVLGSEGTAAQASIPGYRLAGKTGTAQKPEAGGYSKTKYVGSFIGYAPARNPRLLVAVAVDEPRGEFYGSAVAAPAFEKIVSFALQYLAIPPD